MKCFECGCQKFSIALGSMKYCSRCGAVMPAIWNKTDRLIGGM